MEDRQFNLIMAQFTALNERLDKTDTKLDALTEEVKTVSRRVESTENMTVQIMKMLPEMAVQIDNVSQESRTTRVIAAQAMLDANIKVS